MLDCHNNMAQIKRQLGVDESHINKFKTDSKMLQLRLSYFYK